MELEPDFSVSMHIRIVLFSGKGYSVKINKHNVYNICTIRNIKDYFKGYEERKTSWNNEHNDLFFSQYKSLKIP